MTFKIIFGLIVFFITGGAISLESVRKSKILFVLSVFLAIASLAYSVRAYVKKVPSKKDKSIELLESVTDKVERLKKDMDYQESINKMPPSNTIKPEQKHSIERIDLFSSESKQNILTNPAFPIESGKMSDVSFNSITSADIENSKLRLQIPNSGIIVVNSNSRVLDLLFTSQKGVKRKYRWQLGKPIVAEKSLSFLIDGGYLDILPNDNESGSKVIQIGHYSVNRNIPKALEGVVICSSSWLSKELILDQLCKEGYLNLTLLPLKDKLNNNLREINQKLVVLGNDGKRFNVRRYSVSALGRTIEIGSNNTFELFNSQKNWLDNLLKIKRPLEIEIKPLRLQYNNGYMFNVDCLSGMKYSID